MSPKETGDPIENHPKQPRRHIPRWPDPTSAPFRAGNTLYLSGCTARNSDAEGGPVFDQLRVTLDRIVRIVEAEGGRASNIVAMTTYSTDMRTMWPIEGEQVEIWEHYFKGLWPTNAYVEVSALAEPGLNVEITATAVLQR